MKRILHLSYDLRDSGLSKAPAAVRGLIDATRDLAPAVTVDLRRVRRRADEATRRDPARGTLAVDARGFAFGLLMRSTVRRALEMILAAEDRGLIDLSDVGAVHAHKATFEGYVARELSLRLGAPLLVTLRETDLAVVRSRPDLRPLTRKVLRRSSVVFHVAPYIVGEMRQALGRSFFAEHVADKLLLLPNIVERPAGPLAPAVGTSRATLVTILRMTRRWVRRKNLRRLFDALRLLVEGRGVTASDVRLEVIGDGEYLPVVRRWAERRGLAGRVTFAGRVPNARIDLWLRRAAAFVLPSRHETFGIVYAEALLNGTPILYSRRTGFDGMFAGVGVAADPRSPRSIAAGIAELIADGERFRRRIAALRAEGAFDIFTREHARRVYAGALRTLELVRAARAPRRAPAWSAPRPADATEERNA